MQPKSLALLALLTLAACGAAGPPEPPVKSGITVTGQVSTGVSGTIR